MEIKAQGQLRHRFWGEYSAVIALVFESERDANLALPLLPNWTHGKQSKNVLVWVGDSDELRDMKNLLGKYGADEKKIDSCAKSIDYGEKFNCEFVVHHPNQMVLL